MNEAERKKIEEEVIRLVTTALPNEGKAAPADESPSAGSVLCFLTEPLAYPNFVFELIKNIYDNDAVYVNFAPENCGITALSSEGNEQKLTQMTADCECVIILAPSVSALRRLSRGQSANLAEKLILRALLWGKKVNIWLDFKPKKIHKSQYFNEITESLRLLGDMGVLAGEELWEIHAAKIRRAPLSFVTEQDVPAPGSKEELIISGDAVITPLARDRIIQNNILVRKESQT